MAVEWFNDLTGALMDFYENNFTNTQYTLMVWSGLHNTTAFTNSGYTTTDITNNTNSVRGNCDESCD